MSRVQKMRAFVNQRLNAAVEEILAVFENTILKYEEEAALSQEVISRQHALLCALHKPLMDSPSVDVFTQQLLQSKEVQEDQNLQQDMLPKSSILKEEQQEEQLQDLDANEIVEFTYNSSLAVKSCEALKPSVDAKPVGPDQDTPVVLSSDTEDSEDYSKEPADPTPSSDTSQVLCKPKRFSSFLRHMKTHVLEAKQVCSLCREQFETAVDLRHHLLTHRRKRKLQTQTRLQERSTLNRTAEVQETQKPDKCNDCSKTLLRRKHRCQSQRKSQDQKNPEKTKKRRRTKI